MDLAIFGALVLLLAAVFIHMARHEQPSNGGCSCCNCSKDKTVTVKFEESPQFNISIPMQAGSGYTPPGSSTKAAKGSKAAKAAEVPIETGRKSKSWIDKEPTDSNIKSKK